MTRKGRKITRILVLSLAILAVVGVVLLRYGQKQKAKIPDLSFRETLAYTTKDNPEAVITVGILQNGEASYTVYGADAKELPHLEHVYEIGSVTKTFTAALMSRAIEEGRIESDRTLDHYLDLPTGNVYPTIAELLTHTSGYKGFYFAAPMVANFFSGRNSFYNLSKDIVMQQVSARSLSEDSYPFKYSNFGYAVLGLVLEAIYDTDYTTLVNRFADELGLPDTRISDGEGDLGQLWDWAPGDAYLAAGGLTSDISDMLRYAELQLQGEGFIGRSHEVLATLDGADAKLASMDIHMDAIGMAWVIDREQHIIWHNGGTGHYNCYLGFDPASDTAVVVLSNLPPGERIPATILGIKLLNELRD